MHPLVNIVIINIIFYYYYFKDILLCMLPLASEETAICVSKCFLKTGGVGAMGADRGSSGVLV